MRCVERPQGLHLLVCSENEQAVDLTKSGVMLAPLAQELALVASVPLTDEPWEPVLAEFIPKLLSSLEIGFHIHCYCSKKPSSEGSLLYIHYSTRVYPPLDSFLKRDAS